MRVRALFTAVVVAVLAGVGTLVGLTAQAATGCQVVWTANSWPGGFTADVKVSPGDAAHGWTLTWAFPSGQRVTQGWNATVVQSGSSVTASNAAWKDSRQGCTTSLSRGLPNRKSARMWPMAMGRPTA